LQTFRGIASDPAQKLLDRALCISVLPRRDPGQSAVDAKGFVSCRANRDATWSNPAAIVISGGGIFWPVLGARIDLILLTTNRSIASYFDHPEGLLGANPPTAPGPVVPDQPQLRNTDGVVFGYEQSAAGISGIDIAGATLTEDKATNALLYGKDLSNSAILRPNTGVQHLLAVDRFLAALSSSIAPPSGSIQPDRRGSAWSGKPTANTQRSGPSEY
jgi:lipid-binding SYLF domain-containing protein